MNKLMSVLLLLFPLSAFADAQRDAVQEFTRTASAIAAPDWVRVSQRKAASGVDDVGLLAPAQLFFTATGGLTDKGRTLLGRAEGFARQANKKLNVLIPEAVANEMLQSVAHASSGKIQRNAFVGNHVYITARD